MQQQPGKKVLHKAIKASPDKRLEILAPYIGNIVVGVECMHCWYWVAECCRDNQIDFILGHALYMKAINGGTAKNDQIDSYKIAALMRATRDLLRRRTEMVNYGAQLKAHVENPI